MHKRFTKNVRLVLSQAKKDKGKSGLNRIDAFEIIRNIALQKGSFGKTILDSLEIDIEKFDSSYRKLSPKEKISANDLLKVASKMAYLTNSPYIGTEHLVHGFLSLPQNIKLIKVSDISKGMLNSNDRQGNFDRPDFFGEVNSIIDNFFTTEKNSDFQKHSALKSFCNDLGASLGKDHVLVGRTKELERISYVLGRKMKNNPVLVGEPGVGKTAIVEGLAQRIAQGNVPYYLAGKKILTLDLGLLIAGTTFRGEFESRLKNVIAEAGRNSGVILFIDEIHNLIGAGNATGGMDAANLLKPAMSRGEIQIIGATTFDEYQKHIQKDAALERRFQQIMVEEPSIEEASQILSGIKTSYEKYHNVKISENVLRVTPLLAKRYLTERFLPDSAIDLIDEAAAKIRSKNSNGPLLEEIRLLEQEQDRIIQDKEAHVVSDKFEQAILLRQEEKEISEKLKKLRSELQKAQQQNQVTLEESDIRETLSQISNIPKELISEQGKIIAQRVKRILQKNLIGQNKAHKNIFNAILRQVSGIASPNRPLGSFLFIGPTGVGKTYTAKLLSEAISIHGGKSMIQINMSEFSERHNVSRLLGAPAGYVGYEESGELSEKIRKNPYSVVLFDEIEKAELSVLNILLQILEEGEITDAKGRNINFRNTIVILTSNIGTSELDSISQIGFSQGTKKMKKEYSKTKEAVLEQIKEILPPELVDRLDDTIVYEPLDKKQIAKIAKNEIELLTKRISQKKIELVFEKQAVEFIVDSSAKDNQGARSVRRTIQNLVEPQIAQKILLGSKCDSILMKIKNGKILAQAQ